MFAVVRHPDIEALGVIPQATLDAHRARGWFRVSPWANAPADLELSEFAESFVDLDAPAPKTKKEQAS